MIEIPVYCCDLLYSQCVFGCVISWHVVVFGRLVKGFLSFSPAPLFLNPLPLCFSFLLLHLLSVTLFFTPSGLQPSRRHQSFAQAFVPLSATVTDNERDVCGWDSGEKGTEERLSLCAKEPELMGGMLSDRRVTQIKDISVPEAKVTCFCEIQTKLNSFLPTAREFCVTARGAQLKSTNCVFPKCDYQ